MSQFLYEVEPYYGWLPFYSHDKDPFSPYHKVEHNLFYLDRTMNNIPVHPLWDTIGSESLLVKILFADYQTGYAVVELFGEWNDLFENDYKLLAERCLTYLIDQGIQRFIFICENVFHIYLESDDYYEALQEELEGGWISLIRPRDRVLEEMQDYQIDHYFYHSPILDEVPWRKLKPFQLYAMVEARMGKVLE